MLAGCTANHSARTGEPAIETVEVRAHYAVESLPRQVYTPADWPEALSADVYLPVDGKARSGPRPAALVVHGGGWQNRGPDDMETIARQLAAEGFVAINIAHRLAPEYRFPAQLYDLQTAMQWIHSHAESWHIDTRRIVGVGFSSGAHLVSLLALHDPESELGQPFGGEHTQLAAVLAGGLPSNLFKFPDGRLVVEFLGGTRAEVPKQYQQASPISHITSAAPPFFLFHGKADKLVPVDHATDFYAELERNNINGELYLQHWRGHFTSFLTRGNAIEAGIAFLKQQVIVSESPQ
ncbi:MAG TPA: alpha/beta hydrolase [Cellvibrionaceae bacterium]